MKRLCNALLLAALLACASPALAQPAEKPDEKPADVCATELTREKLDNPPERKTKFDVVEEPLKLRLHDVKAVDQKYVAVVRIELPMNMSNDIPGRRTLEDFPRDEKLKKVYELQFFRSSYWLSPSNGRPYTQRDGAEIAFRQMLELIPEKRRPAPEVVEFLTSPDLNRLLLDDQPRGPGRESHRGLRLLAASPEQAERRAEAMMTFLDQGFTRPIQLALFDQRQQHCQAIEKLKPEVAAGREMARTVYKELEQYADFIVEMLPELRVQQLQLEVELAGVKARLATCEKLLQATMRDDRRKQIEDVKIAGEIELAGFEARQAKSAEFVAKVKKKQELSARHSEVAAKANRAEYQIVESQRSVAAIDRDLAAFGPVKLEDDRVAIHPIEWTQQ